MKRFGIIGNPVAGSMSPVLFGAAYEGRYPYDLIDRPTFQEAWQAFLDGYDGVNVTAPYKQDACAAVDWLSEGARLSGAVNLVVRRDGLLRGYNTDIAGVEEALRESGHAFAEALCESGHAFAEALVVGTGGAARAAIVAALRLGCAVTVIGRSPEKVAALAARFACQGMVLQADAPLEASPDVSQGPGTPAVADEKADAPLGVPGPSYRPSLVIYTLPGSAPVPAGLPLEEAVVLEAEYKRPRLVSAPCKAYISGRRWLLWQAVAGYSLFTGEEPSLEKILRAL